MGWDLSISNAVTAYGVRIRATDYMRLGIPTPQPSINIGRTLTIAMNE